MATARRLADRADDDRPTLGAKLLALDWVLVLLICLAAALGIAMLYSAAGGDMQPWAGRQAARFGVGFLLMLAVALTDLRIWLRYAYLLFGACLLLLIGVELAGLAGMGARRWITLGPMTLQPSELTKLGLVLALARWFHDLDDQQIGRLYSLVPPALMVFVPALLVLRQPDLGTAMMLVAAGGAMFYLGGVALWKLLAVTGAAVAAAPLAWQFMREYQRQRLMTFLDPERDPLGAGYHILQSQIALGSGGLFGKGYLGGTQSHLNFLPEKQTDFIFTMLAEELGLAGCLLLLGIYVAILAYCYVIALRSGSQFGRLLGLGVGVTFFLYAFINMAMVMGILPVVGVPLPLVSYGGTAMLTLQIGFGLLLSVSIHRDLRIERSARDPV